MKKVLAKIPIKDVADHFVKTWKFPDGEHCHHYECHLDIINQMFIFDIELHETQKVEVDIKQND